MCTRFLLLRHQHRQLLESLGIAGAAQFADRYNFAPGTNLPAVRTTASGDGRELATLRWGILTRWSKARAGAPLVNARAESLAEKPTFRSAVHRRRCVIPASGFYEWERKGRERQPWLFERADRQPFFLAALWEKSFLESDEEIETCAVVTSAPNALMRPIHERMPVILSIDDCRTWLDPAVTEAAALAPILAPAADDELTARAVSRHANSIQHNDPGCIAPASDDPPDAQFSLGL
jgi:putative SOS response-associated peptidase YedK